MDITTWTRSSVSLRLIETSGGALYGVRYAWDAKPCLFKLCGIYATGTDLPSPPFISYHPSACRVITDQIEPIIRTL